ncbi:oligosaccharide flippase family protein [Pedobacter cryotolerans]|uniref:Polysaccharide biosynthesis protein n=1 Tax=Pedobacter cryotolerans TaxID=2571270 RepID=A0A4U1CAI6_9SPHI|nr:oligosaccharide flippase family protein [Pedobacter cryotolerans]TKC03493.1 hypothetical protein FA045_02680 [Pedobacter cryotolerans]
MYSLPNIDSKQRNNNIKIQIYLTLLLRGISIILSFYVIRITLGYLGKDLYGIWIVLLSIISWISLCDIGVGNGLRNKLTIALAKNDTNLARSYVSTAYIILAFIAIVIFGTFIIASYFVSWQDIFNSRLLTREDYHFMMIIFIGGIVVSFVLSLINSILNAYQKSSLTNIGTIITNALFVILLVIFKSYFLSGLIKIISLYSICLIVSNIIVSLIFFYQNQHVTPHYRFYSKEKIKEILNLGGSFFVIQIAVLLIFTVDNFIILQLLGTQSVSLYNVVFKLFSIFTLGFGIIISPLWSAFTEAKEKNDYIWMKGIIKKLNKLMILIAIGLFVMLFIYQPILDFWLPKDTRISPSFGLILSFSLFILLSIWNNIYSFFLNGVSVVKMQVRTSIIGALINVPLAILFVKYFDFGLPGVVLSMCISLSIFSVFGPIETYNFFKKHNNE